jgi:hypothetical protein
MRCFMTSCPDVICSAIDADNGCESTARCMDKALSCTDRNQQSIRIVSMQAGKSRSDLTTLAWSIAHCPHFLGYDAGTAGVCSDVIKAQGDWRRSPEGWTGRLQEAPILFVTSNPNTDVTKPGTDPVFRSAEELAAFNDLYFDSHGVGGVQTWRQMERWATALLGGRAATPGKDFALTDAVRCASPIQYGVDQAIGRCAGLYLGSVLASAGARVVGFCGKARDALQEFVEPPRYRMTLAVGDVIGPMEFFGRERMLIGLRHPADVYHGSLELTVPNSADRERLVAFLARH